jgi:beta-lactamase regulating signal transducer with metallopeptidase domain
MDDLGLAVAFCVVQVTLLAAVVSVCYLCSRRSHPGFRSSIASTGVFVVLALSVLCLIPYPNWVEVLDLGNSELGLEAAGRNGGEASTSEEATGPANRKSLAERAAVTVPLVPVTSPPQSVRPVTAEVEASRSTRPQIQSSVAAESNGQVASRATWFAGISRNLQRDLSWTVRLRDWLVTRLQALLRWGWLAGALLLVGITLNLLRLAVGWWELHRFRQRSAPIDSAALSESLDIVQAVLSLRTPVELRQTTEMTSPATIGWWRPVVILPADWEEWNEEERLGVLAHELAHVSRHDFMTGLFSQLVLALHFYHPLINWLVNRLHLEQELAADAAAVRVLGGNKPYLRMLAGMALKDHTTSLPRAARTFFPQSGTLMARVELLRGNKLEAGEASFSWRAAVRGVLVCLGLGLAGLRPLAGSDTADLPAVPLTSSFVPETAAGWVVWSPARVPVGHPVSRLLFDPANRWPTQVVDGVGQISLFWLESDGSPTGDVTSLLPDGVALNFRSSVIRDAAFEYLNNHPEENLAYRLLGGPFPQRAVLMKHGEHELLQCRDDSVLRSSLASASSKPSLAWSSAWERASSGDAVIGFRPSLAARFRVPGTNYTAVLEDLVNQLEAWSLSGEFALASLDLEQDRCEMQVVPRSGHSPENLLSTVENLRQDWSRRVARALPPNGQADDYDAVTGNDWCQRMVEKCRVKAGSDRLQIEPPLSAMLGIAFRLRDQPIETSSFDRHWSEHEAAHLGLSLGVLRSALLAYRADHGHFPPPALRSAGSQHSHSWRVALLPYLGRQDLYNQYRLDLPWNSSENLRLLSQIPDVYRGFGSFSNATQVIHGGVLSAKRESLVLTRDWTELESLVALGTPEVSIPWTAPSDESVADALFRRADQMAPLGGLGQLTTGDLDVRILTKENDELSR